MLVEVAPELVRVLVIARRVDTGEGVDCHDVSPFAEVKRKSLAAVPGERFRAKSPKDSAVKAQLRLCSSERSEQREVLRCRILPRREADGTIMAMPDIANRPLNLATRGTTGRLFRRLADLA
jgi:hypothetical protein